MDGSAKYRPPHSYRAGRRGNETSRGGHQRSQDASRDATSNAQVNRRGGKQQQGMSRQSQTQQKPQQQQQQPPPPQQPPQPRLPSDQHTPLGGFNAAEVRDLLAGGVDTTVRAYKPEARTDTPRAGNPWGLKRTPGHCSSKTRY